MNKVSERANIKGKDLSLISPQLSQYHVYCGYTFLVIAITYLLPDNILDTSFTLRKFVEFMAFTFPSVAKYGKYAAFPQVAQLVYSLCIVTLPVAVIIAYEAAKNDDLKNDTKVLWGYFRIAFFAFLVFCFMLPAIFFWFPGGPDISDGRLLTREMYREKWAFLILLCLLFEGFIGGVCELVVKIKLEKMYRAVINNANKFSEISKIINTTGTDDTHHEKENMLNKDDESVQGANIRRTIQKKLRMPGYKQEVKSKYKSNIRKFRFGTFMGLALGILSAIYSRDLFNDIGQFTSYITVAAFFALYIYLANKYYRCPACGYKLNIWTYAPRASVEGNTSDLKSCPRCGAPFR